MTRFGQFQIQAITEIKLRLIRNGTEQAQDTFCVFLCIKRKSGFVLRESFSIGILRLFFLESAAIRKKDPAKIPRAGGTVDRTPKALLHEYRKIACMIEMGMGKNNAVYFLRINRKRLPVSEAKLFETLKKAAIDQDLSAVVFNEVPRSGNSVRCA